MNETATDRERIDSKISVIHGNAKQIDLLLARIRDGEISSASGFSLISKFAKSIAWECEGFLREVQSK